MEKSKYEVALEIADRFNLLSECIKEAGYELQQKRYIPNNLNQVDKALELYLKRYEKILMTLK